MDTEKAVKFDQEITDVLLKIEGEFDKVFSERLQDLFSNYVYLAIYQGDLPVPEKTNIEQPTKSGTKHAKQSLKEARKILASLDGGKEILSRDRQDLDGLVDAIVNKNRRFAFDVVHAWLEKTDNVMIPKGFHGYIPTEAQLEKLVKQHSKTKKANHS